MPVPEQEGPRAIAAATDQHEQLRIFAADIVLRLERAAPLVTVVAGASRSDPELAELLTTLHALRLQNLHALTGALAANGPLRLSEEEAVETVWALTSPELHQLLVRPRLVDAPLPRLARRKPRRAAPVGHRLKPFVAMLRVLAIQASSASAPGGQAARDQRPTRHNGTRWAAKGCASRTRCGAREHDRNWVSMTLRAGH